MDLKLKKTRAGTDFFAINPKGSVPVLQLDNGAVLTENIVILKYLVDFSNTTKLLPKTDDFNHYKVLEWLSYIATELHKSFSPLFNPSITTELKSQLFIPLLQSKLSYVNNYLQDSPYLIGDHFTLPDAYLFVILFWTTSVKLDLAEWSNLARYFVKLSSRQSIKISLEQEELRC